MQYLAQLKAFAAPFMEGWHDLPHYQRVWEFAQQIQANEGGDLQVIMAAVWLHDIGRKESVPGHPLIGARHARQFLPTIAFPQEKIESVAQAILLHDEHGGQRTIEDKIVYDADRLDCFTVSGIFRCVLEPARTGRHPITGKPVRTLPELLLAAAGYLLVANANLNTTAAREIAMRYRARNVDGFLNIALAEQDPSPI